jgi:N-acetylgalactosamine kinase
MMTVREWLNAFQNDSSCINSRMREVYGGDASILAERRTLYLDALRTFARHYNENEKALIVRAPGRINLLGTHVDHRGGYVNYMAIDRETVLVASPRTDDRVVLHNANESFGARAFHIAEKLPPARRGDWMSYIENNHIVPGDWENYIRAGTLYVQNCFPDVELRGMHIALAGDVPVAAGLSSSSTLVVAALEATLRLNDLSIPHEEKATRCGEAEWYVGTRGGAGDHAAMLYAQRQAIVRLRFFPLRTEKNSFPSGYRVVACNSFVKHTSRSIFNERVAAYEIGMMLLRKQFPEFADQLKRLRDINPDHLGVSTAKIYQMLKALPERISRNQIQALLPDQHEALTRIFLTHDEPADGYRVRGVCLFGVAECARSEQCRALLTQGEMEQFGKLKYISHNGDRVVTHKPDGGVVPWEDRISDHYLDSLIADLESGDKRRIQAAQLMNQPGGYRCSCEALDLLVDLAKQVEGVVGAGLSGGGLGGCVLVVVKEEAVENLIQTMKYGYYDPKGLPLGTVVCSSVEGAGVLINFDAPVR